MTLQCQPLPTSTAILLTASKLERTVTAAKGNRLKPNTTIKIATPAPLYPCFDTPVVLSRFFQIFHKWSFFS